jgi:adenosylcobyric acid synthase
MNKASGSKVAKLLMILGTGSEVGKSIIAAGLGRIFSQMNLKVCPFKAQNMSNNSYVTPDQKEIARAQVMQAEACGLQASVDMNPILLKPGRDGKSQVIIQGEPKGEMNALEYIEFKHEAARYVMESYLKLAKRFEVILLEGAGGAAEINLRTHEIVNFYLAKRIQAPCILVADIDRGGVFASILGTIELLTPEERRLVKGIIINKFRGNPDILTLGIQEIEKRTQTPVLGIVPYISGLWLDTEDSMSLPHLSYENKNSFQEIKIGVIKLPMISNYTDFLPLYLEPDTSVSFLDPPYILHGLDAVIIPGTRSTLQDLRTLLSYGFKQRIMDFPGIIIGICGGYQMLGHKIIDPIGVGGPKGEEKGLDLLKVTTIMKSKKTLLNTEGFSLLYNERQPIKGYAIHHGQTEPTEGRNPCFVLNKYGPEGTKTSDLRIWGTYLHGIFDLPEFRRSFIDHIRKRKGLRPLKNPNLSWQEFKDTQYNLLANHLKENIRLNTILHITGLREPKSKD